MALGLSLFAIAACHKGARVSGVLSGASGADIEVRLLDVSKYRAIDTVKTDASGAFRFNVPVEAGQPEFIYLFYKDRRIASLLLQKGDRVRVTSDTLGNYSVTGSPETDKLIGVEKDEAEFANSFASATARLEDLMPSSEEAAQARRDLAKQYLEYYRGRVAYVLSNSKSLTVVPVMYQVIGENLPLFSQNTDALYFRAVSDSLKTVYPESKYVKALSEEADRRTSLMELDMRIRNAEKRGYPDLELPSVGGEKVRLSSVGAKVIMLYFWASADVDQKFIAVEKLKPLYEKYHSRGFEIYSVCIGTDKSAWAATVKNQKLPWINVCDGLGAASPVIGTYNVQTLPTSYIICQGDIVSGQNPTDEASLRRYLNSVL